jgi:hypothetical protein
MHRRRAPDETPPARLGGLHGAQGKKQEGPRGALSVADGGGAQDFVAGCTPGLSLKNCLLSSMKFFH